jgi:hypothetical protein
LALLAFAYVLKFDENVCKYGGGNIVCFPPDAARGSVYTFCNSIGKKDEPLRDGHLGEEEDDVSNEYHIAYIVLLIDTRVY